MHKHVLKLVQPSNGYKSMIAAACVFGAIIVICCLSCWCITKYPPYTLAKVRSLIQDGIKWSMVADQDTNMLLSLVHSTYALSYINVARHMVSDTDIGNITNMHVGELHKELRDKQDQIMHKLYKKYPKLRQKGGCGGIDMATGWLR